MMCIGVYYKDNTTTHGWLIKAWLAVMACRILLGEHVLYIGCIELFRIIRLFSSPFVLASSSVYQVHCSGLLLEVKVDHWIMYILLYIIHHKLCPTIENSAEPCLCLAVGRPWLALGEPFSSSAVLSYGTCRASISSIEVTSGYALVHAVWLCYEIHKHGSWLVGL